MTFNPLSATIPHVAYACLGGFVVLFGMFSLFLREKLYIGEACWAFLFGVIIGPHGIGIFDPRSWAGGHPDTIDSITLEFTRVVLAIGVFAIGVELPKAYIARHWKSMFFLLVPVMTWGWFVSAGLIYAFIPELGFLSCLAVAACLTPTDPILAAAVVGGKYADNHVPAHLRHLLAAESGCNDGAAFPFLYIALYLILDHGNVGKAAADWFLFLWLYEIIMGCVIGGVLGFAFRHLMKFCQSRDLIDRQSYVAQYVSLAMLTIGVTTILGSDDLLAAFTCGTVFAWDGFFNRQTEESVFSSVIDLLFNVAAFVYVGAWMPFDSFHDPETSLTVPRLIAIAILVLLLRRLPIMIALYRWIPDIKTFREALFSGHFGPIGIGAIFISTLAARKLDEELYVPQAALLAVTIQPIVAFIVLCSIIIHGLSIPSFSLGRRVHSVSRTWSRHTAPDWTNLTRLVDRGGDDIVINRDIEMGESPTPCEKSDVQRVGTPKLGSEVGTVEIEVPRVPDGNEPRDGQGEVVQEWQEGDHGVIERQASPGSDVEVVVTDDKRPTQDKTKTPHEGGDVTSQVRGRHRDRPTRDSDAIINEGVQGLEPENESVRVASQAKNTGEDVEDGEWDSDRSNDSPSPLSGQNIQSDGLSKRIRSEKHTATASHVPKHKLNKKITRGRRQSPVRKKISSHAERFMKSVDPLERGAGSNEEMRGHWRSNSVPNTQPSSRIHSPANSRPSSVKNLRLERVRDNTPSSSRDLSPSGSVRFSDEVKVH